MREGEEGELNNDADGTVHNNSTIADDDEDSQLATSRHPCSLRHDKCKDPILFNLVSYSDVRVQSNPFILKETSVY